MRHHLCRISFYAIIFCVLPVQAEIMGELSAEHIVWNNTPIRFSLPINEEKRIDFPIPVEIEAPSEVVAKTKRLTIRENGSVYWTASAAFTTQRITVKTHQGHTYLFDVSASKSASLNPIIILDYRFEGAMSKQTDLNKQTDSSDSQLDYHHLARYVFQELFSPPRLINKPSGVIRIPVSDKPLPLYKGGELKMTPMLQFQTSTVPTLFVTALDVRNLTPKKIFLNPLYLRGEFRSASSYYKYVGPMNSSSDWNVWLIITERPFDEVMP